MTDIDPRLLVVLLFLLFSSTFTKFFRKLKHKIFKPSAPVFNVTYQFKHQDPVSLKNKFVIVPKHLILGAVSVYDDIQTVPEIESGIRSDLLDHLEKNFYSEQENKRFAMAAIKAFRAWHSGVMLKILDPDNQLTRRQKKKIVPAISAPSFKDFVLYTFLGLQNADLMPNTFAKLQKQYTIFFQDYTLKEDEFLLAWADQCMMTNKHMIFFNTDDPPKIVDCIPIQEISDVKIDQVGIEKMQ